MSKQTTPWQPGKEPPPVAKRPRCACCSKPLLPVVHTGYPQIERDGVSVMSRSNPTKYWAGEYSSYGGLFHSLDCALKFAVAAHAAGIRMKA